MIPPNQPREQNVFPADYLVWLLSVAAAGIVLAVLVLTQNPSLLRVILAFGFTLVFPGLAWVRCFSLSSWVAQLALIVPLSLALNLLVAQVLLYSRRSSADNALWVILVITATGVIVEGRRHVLAGRITPPAPPPGVPTNEHMD